MELTFILFILSSSITIIMVLFFVFRCLLLKKFYSDGILTSETEEVVNIGVIKTLLKKKSKYFLPVLIIAIVILMIGSIVPNIFLINYNYSLKEVQERINIYNNWISSSPPLRENNDNGNNILYEKLLEEQLKELNLKMNIEYITNNKYLFFFIISNSGDEE